MIFTSEVCGVVLIAPFAKISRPPCSTIRFIVFLSLFFRCFSPFSFYHRTFSLTTPLQNDKKKFLKKQSEFVYENYICLFCEKQSLFVAWNWVCRPSREDQLKRNSFCLRQITQDSRMILHRAGKVQTPLFTRFVPWFSPVYKALITQLVKISQPSLNLFKLGGAI